MNETCGSLKQEALEEGKENSGKLQTHLQRKDTDKPRLDSQSRQSEG